MTAKMTVKFAHKVSTTEYGTDIEIYNPFCLDIFLVAPNLA